MTDTATAATTFGRMTTTRDESEAKGPEESLPRKPKPEEKPERAREIVFQLSGVEVRRRIGMVFQKPNPFPKSVYDNVAYGPRINGAKRSEISDIVEKALTQAALWDEVHGKLRQSALALSGGQQQRLCIARCLAVAPDVILMDEPCSALDPIATARIEDLMDELKNLYTIVIVTHNMQQAARVSDRTAFFTAEVDDAGHRRGRLIEYDVTETIFTTPSDPRTEGYITGRFG